MTWAIEYDDDLQIVVLTYSGKTTGEDIKEAAAARIAMGKEKGVNKFLIDAGKVETEASATLSIYEVPEDLYLRQEANRKSRIAVIRPESSVSREMVEFYETACLNLGWLVKVFQDRDNAVEWLLR